MMWRDRNLRVERLKQETHFLTELLSLSEQMEFNQSSKWNHFIELNREKKDFYRQEISDEVLAFIKENPRMLAPVREGSKLYCMAFPCNMKEYLNTDNEKMK